MIHCAPFGIPRVRSCERGCDPSQYYSNPNTQLPSLTPIARFKLSVDAQV